MNFPIYIAKRYLFAKKSHNVINIISGISILGVTVGTLALVVILSAFNGLENLVISLFNSFDPDIKISIKEGKTFNTIGFPKEEVKNLPSVAYYTEVLEEQGLVKYREQQYIATVKGVEENFIKMSGLDTMMTEGNLVFEKNDREYAIVGQGIAYSLSLTVSDIFNPMTIYMAKRGKKVSINPKDAFTIKKIQAGGIFSIQKDFDTKYILTPISFVRELLNYNTEVSAIEIKLKDGVDVELAKKQLRALVGDQFDVKDRFEQHDLLYKIMRSEKWAVFLILTFILIIAAFNSVASLTMLILDKKKDIGILWSMGCDIKAIRKIFLFEGVLISLIGNIVGLGLGAGICYIQIKFKLIEFQGNFVANSIPVTMELQDFIYVFLTVSLIGFITAALPASMIKPDKISI